MSADKPNAGEVAFARWFANNYGPGCILSDPAWHAPRIYRAARSAGGPPQSPTQADEVRVLRERVAQLEQERADLACAAQIANETAAHAIEERDALRDQVGRIPPADLNRLVEVENVLLAHVKNKTQPTTDECRVLAYRLGVPDEFRPPAAERDAENGERYRWLRKQRKGKAKLRAGDLHVYQWSDRTEAIEIHGAALDAAIDAARKGEGNG